jgi:hypothetical protein
MARDSLRAAQLLIPRWRGEAGMADVRYDFSAKWIAKQFLIPL